MRKMIIIFVFWIKTELKHSLNSPTVIAAAITSQKDKSKLPTHISLDAERYGLAKDSIVLLEQVRTLDKKRLKERMGELDVDAMDKVNGALSVSFGLG